MTGARGGVAILVVFMLLTLMAGVGFATSRNLQRELAICGDAVQGAKAGCAADSGLAWFLAAAGAAGLQCRLASPGSGCGEGLPLAHPEGLLPGARDAPLQQSFELRIRHLGALPRPDGAPDPGAADQLWQVTATGRCGAKGTGRRGFLQVRELLVAVAPAAPDDRAAAGGPDRPDPRQPAQAPPAGLRVLAWRSGWPDR